MKTIAIQLIKLAKEITKPTQDDLLDFLIKNPNPADSLVHKWAEDNGWDVDEVEALFYKLATRMAKLMRGGRSKGEKAKVDPEELKMGIEVEYEHVDDKELAEKIARDHLDELDNYYTLLKKMESDNED